MAVVDKIELEKLDVRMDDISSAVKNRIQQTFALRAQCYTRGGSCPGIKKIEPTILNETSVLIKFYGLKK